MKSKLYTIHISLDEVIALRQARDITINKFNEMKKRNDEWDTLPHNDTQRVLNALVDKVNETVYYQYQNELKAKDFYDLSRR